VNYSNIDFRKSEVEREVGMVAEKIKEYIKEQGLKQGAVAAKAGLTDGEMSAYLTGQIRLRADVLFRICDALGVSADIFRPDPQ
jgi:transcriptional regulator with XRE-family HTH domain